MIVTITPNPLLDFVLHSQQIPDPGGKRVRQIPYTVGGKGINVARMLKTLGRPALALSFAGGNNGAKILEGLQQQGIACELIDTEAETRMGINLVVEKPVYHTWWIESGEELKKKEIDKMLGRIAELLPETSFIAMSGTIPGRMNDDFYQNILKLCLQHRAEVYLDAREEPLKRACTVGGFFLKHNREEALATFAIDPFVNPVEFFKMLQNCRIWGAMITDGKRDILLWDGDKIWHLQPVSAREVSSVGCGDATLAGLIYGRSQGLSLLDAAKWGLAAGAADAEMPGPCDAGAESVAVKLKLVAEPELLVR
jgi:1-phosphofructokinase family hexose kinase